MSGSIVEWSVYNDPRKDDNDWSSAKIDLARVVGIARGAWHSERGRPSWSDAILVLDTGARLHVPMDYDLAQREWCERLEIMRGERAPPPWRGSG